MAQAGGTRREKDQKMARDLADRGIFHGHRKHPGTQGVNYPKLDHVGSAAHRRRQAR